MVKTLQIVFLLGSPLSLGQGGVETQAEKTREFLEKRGHKVYWFDFGDKTLADKADIFHLFGTGWHLYPLARLVSLKKKPILISPVFYAESLTKWILYRMTTWIPQSYPKTRKLLLKTADVLLPNSKAEAEQISALFGVKKEKIFVVPNGVETDFIGQNPSGFRKKWLSDMAPDAPFVLSVHRIERRKNTLNLVKAALMLKTPLVIIGGKDLVKSEKYAAEVTRLAGQSKGLVRLLGSLRRDELKDAYAAAHVHAMPSFMETPGIASLEAGVNGCNLVVGDCPPVREYFSGIAFISKQDPESIAKNIKSALTVKRNCFNQAEKIREKYSWERAAELTEQAYFTALKNNLS